jgi:hypothetical protein
MNENARKFEKDLRENEELRKKYAAEMERIAEAKEAESEAEAVVMAAKALGYEVEISDIEKAIAASQELDAEELENVSGGECTDWCFADYACFAAFFHSSGPSDGKEACWSDFQCMMVYYGGKMMKCSSNYTGCTSDYTDPW